PPPAVCGTGSRLFTYCFFFSSRRRHTRFSRDWSSDVCSSDLNIKYFYDRGIRYITLTHSRDNQICDSSYDTKHTWNGLSPFGVEDRKSTRLNSSHVKNSYAVFCLKKKKKLSRFYNYECDSLSF